MGAVRLWRTIRDLIRNDVPVRPHACHCGRVITRLSQQGYAAWRGCGHIACPRCGRRMWAVPHPAGTARLIADLKTTAVADAPATADTTPTNP